MNQEYAYMPATELAKKLENKELSPVELTQYFLDRIESLDSKVKAYITVSREEALKQAKRAEEEINNGDYKGPLHGMPIGIKDTYKTKGITSTSGSELYKDNVPEETSTVVQNLLDAGGIVLGKLNMHSLGPGSAGINPYFGTTRNPWNLDYICGGSSSGSGAALAAGFAPIVTGTDMWGSLRVPAAMTGVYGFKPTNGLASSYANIPTSTSLDSTGPMARNIGDLALMLQEVVGYDPKDAKSLNVVIPDYSADLDKGIKGLRIGIPSYYRQGMDAEVERLFNESIEKLKELGAKVYDIELPELKFAKFAGFATALSESGANYYDSLRDNPNNHAKDVRALMSTGSLISGTQYVKAQQARREMAEGFNRAFEDVDVVLAPTYAGQTPRFDEENWVDQALNVAERALPVTVPANLTGRPALSVPMGLDQDGVPAGMQFIGPGLSEKQLLQVGRAWESTNPIDYSQIAL